MTVSGTEEVYTVVIVPPLNICRMSPSNLRVILTVNAKRTFFVIFLKYSFLKNRGCMMLDFNIQNIHVHQYWLLIKRYITIVCDTMLNEAVTLKFSKLKIISLRINTLTMPQRAKMFNV